MYFVKRASSLGQVLPQIMVVLFLENSSIKGMLIAFWVLAITLSKRVSPATVQLEKPMFFNNFQKANDFKVRGRKTKKITTFDQYYALFDAV